MTTQQTEYSDQIDREDMPVDISRERFINSSWLRLVVALVGSVIATVSSGVLLNADRSQNGNLSNWAGNSVNFALAGFALTILGFYVLGTRRRALAIRWAIIGGTVLAISETFGKSLDAYSTIGVWRDNVTMAINGLLLTAGFFW